MLQMIKMVKFDICPKCNKKGLSDKNIICKYCEFNPLFDSLTNMLKRRIGLMPRNETRKENENT